MAKQIAEEKRLLTQKEREFIIESWNQIKWTEVKIGWLIGIVYFAIISILWGYINVTGTGLRGGVIAFLFLCGFTGVLISINLGKWYGLVKKAKSNTLYAREAIYDKTTGMYHITFLYIYKKGKIKYHGANMLVREKVQKGDKVIVLQMKGQAWVYKARE